MYLGRGEGGGNVIGTPCTLCLPPVCIAGLHTDLYIMLKVRNMGWLTCFSILYTMAPIEAKNYQCKMGFRGFETRNLGNSRQFFTMIEALRLKNRQCNCTGCTGQNGALGYYLLQVRKKPYTVLEIHQKCNSRYLSHLFAIIQYLLSTKQI